MINAVMRFFEHPVPHLVLGALNIFFGFLNDSPVALFVGGLSCFIAAYILWKWR